MNDGFLRKVRFLHDENFLLPVLIFVPKSLDNRLESRGKVSWFEFKPCDDCYFVNCCVSWYQFSLSFDFNKMSSKVLRDVTVFKYGYTNNFQSFLKFNRTHFLMNLNSRIARIDPRNSLLCRPWILSCLLKFM